MTRLKEEIVCDADEFISERARNASARHGVKSVSVLATRDVLGPAEGSRARG